MRKSPLLLLPLAFLPLSLAAEKMKPAEEPEEVGLVSIGETYFPVEPGLTTHEIPNHSFESTAESGQGWTLWGWDWAEGDAPDGNRYLASKPGEKLRLVLDNLPAESWQPYLVSMWLRTDGEASGGYLTQSRIRFGTSTPLQVPNTQGEWRRVGFYVRAAMEAQSARLLFNLPANLSISVDDVRYREASEVEFSKAYAGWRSTYPQRDLAPRPDDGQNLALFLRKLQSPRKPVRPLLVMGIGSSYTNMLGNGEPLVQHIRSTFPEAPEVRYYKHVGSAVEFDYTQGWMQQLVVGEQPDLVILYSGGNAEDLDVLLTDFRKRSTADIIIASLHLRERDEVISPETIDNEQWDTIRLIASKHGVEFVESRREWATYLKEQNQDIHYLLRDAVHQSDHGALVINENITRHVSPNDTPAYNPDERERRIAATSPSSIRDGETLTQSGSWTVDGDVLKSSEKGASLTLRFKGNRVDLIGTSVAGGGSATVTIDDQPADDYPAFHTTLIIPGPDNFMPDRGLSADRAPHAIRLHQNIVPQNWTLKMISDQGDYELIGSVTGPDGKGNNGEDFTSDSGQIEVPTALWRRRLEKDGTYTNRTGDTFSWSVYRATMPEVSFASDEAEESLWAKSLVQNASNDWHSVTITCLGDGEVAIQGFDVFEPPLQ